MAHTRGLVISVKEDGKAQVATDKKNSCGGCGTTHHCHSCLSNSKIMTEALNSAGAEQGDLVEISLNSGLILKSAAIMYLIPIAGLMTGALIGAGISNMLAMDETTSAIIFGIAGLCLGFMVTAFISKWMSSNNRLTPVISRIIKPDVKRSNFSLDIDPFVKTEACSECQ